MGFQLYEQVKATLGKIAIANIRNDKITIPNDDGNTIPIIALKKSDKFCLGPEFNKPTLGQQDNYESAVSLWHPSELPTAQMVSEIIEVPENYSMNIIAPRAGAATQAISKITTIEALNNCYDLSKPPCAYMAKLLLRPIVILNLDNAEPDVICHELVHVEQKIEKPIRMYSSQHDIDMDKLGDELYAYHVGAGVRRALMNASGVGGDPYTQLQAESVRIEHNGNLPDSFKPNESLLRLYRMRGMDDIIDNDLIYDSVIKHIENLANR